MLSFMFFIITFCDSLFKTPKVNRLELVQAVFVSCDAVENIDGKYYG